MTVRTAHGIWVVPPQRAVWIPAKVPHSTEMSGIVAMRTLWFKPGTIKSLAKRCHVINVTPLLRELILQACTLGKLNMRRASDKHTIGLLLCQLKTAKNLPLQLPMPTDSRAIAAADLMITRPAAYTDIRDLGKKVGASKRTLERLFENETGLSIGKWRQQLRLLHVMRSIAAGEKVTGAALDVGYNSPSAFIAMFKKTLGQTPTQYFS